MNNCKEDFIIPKGELFELYLVFKLSHKTFKNYIHFSCKILQVQNTWYVWNNSYDKGVGCPNKNYTNCLENNFIYVNVEQLYSLFKKKKYIVCFTVLIVLWLNTFELITSLKYLILFNLILLIKYLFLKTKKLINYINTCFKIYAFIVKILNI